MEALADEQIADVLAPREADLSVMFCDLRDFSKRSERDADQLLDLLARVSDALGIMTHRILDTDGVIGDFHGDAAMGFWGWPAGAEDAAVRAAQTAKAIVAESTQMTREDRFRFGIRDFNGQSSCRTDWYSGSSEGDCFWPRRESCESSRRFD